MTDLILTVLGNVIAGVILLSITFGVRKLINDRRIKNQERKSIEEKKEVVNK